MTGKGSSHWSDFWATGALTSLPQDFAGNYEGELAQFWAGEFAALGPEARILDICTGNGALALLAARHGQDNGREFTIAAVDAARVDPARIARAHPDTAALLPAIRFFDQTAVEVLDLPEGSFDFLMSQYGIEYCDWPRAAARIHHLLAPGGRFSMIAHAADSAMLAQMRHEEEEYAWLEEKGLFSAVHGWLAGKSTAKELRQRMAALEGPLGREMQARQSALFRSVLQMVTAARRMNGAELKRGQPEFRGFLRQLEQGRRRLADFLRVNRAIAADPDWYRVFVDAGLVLLDSGDILYQGKHHSGRFFRFQRPA